MSDIQQHKIAFIGCGNLARAMIEGLLGAGIEPGNIITTNRDARQLTEFIERHAVCYEEHNSEAARVADVVFLSVKPAQLQQVCKQISDDLNQGSIVISVAAGVELSLIRRWLSGHVNVVRAMPNLAASVAESATTMYVDGIAQRCRDKVKQLLYLLGLVVVLPREEDLAIATAIAGSGLAYFCLLEEAMVSVAERLGFDEKRATQLVKQVALGAAQLVQPEEVCFEELRMSVTSPKGTTEAAIRSIQEQGFERMVGKGVEAAFLRSLELRSPKE